VMQDRDAIHNNNNNKHHQKREMQAAIRNNEATKEVNPNPNPDPNLKRRTRRLGMKRLGTKRYLCIITIMLIMTSNKNKKNTSSLYGMKRRKRRFGIKKCRIQRCRMKRYFYNYCDNNITNKT
jgi:hypothetical protein